MTGKPMVRRRRLLRAAPLAATMLAAPALVRAQETPGVSANEIRIGSTTSLSGPVSALGVQAKCQEAFFRRLNEKGGIAGRKINYIYYDDGFSPPKTVEQVRRLIEEDKVAFLFNMLGTAPNSAVVKYINQKKVPHLFLSVNGDKWGDYKTNPWTMGFAPSARIESQIYAKYALQQKDGARFAILYQNDDLGKDYVAGVRDVLKDGFERQATAVSYEVTDPTVDSQMINLRATNADAVVLGGTAKFVAQAIRSIHDLGWKTQVFIASGATSVAGVIEPVGREKALGVMSSAYIKDPNDPAWANDPGIADYAAFMRDWFPAGNVKDTYNTYAYTVAQVLMHVLEQCQGSFTRDNIMKQATSLRNVEVPTLLPGVVVNTGPTNYHPLRQVQLMRWDGQTWSRFGKIIEGADI